LEDLDPLDAELYKSQGDSYLKEVARNNAQYLITQLWQLPTKRVEDVIVAQLPKPTMILPREKEIPKPKPPSKWDKYAKMKGIQKRKQGRMLWDDQTKSWKPRWGYERANNPQDDWLIEIPDQKDPYKDYFGERQELKKERVAKNELQRLRNLARSSGGGPNEGIGLNLENKSSKDVSKQLDRARRSTASLGRFNEKVDKERPSRNIGKKHNFLPNEKAIKDEKDSSLQIWKRIEARRPKLDAEKALATKTGGGGGSKRKMGMKNDEYDDNNDQQKPRKRERKNASGGGGGKSGGESSGGRKGTKGSKRKGKMQAFNKKKHQGKKTKR